MGFVATGKAARAIEQIMLAALKANRPLSADELAQSVGRRGRAPRRRRRRNQPASNSHQE